MQKYKSLRVLQRLKEHALLMHQTRIAAITKRLERMQGVVKALDAKVSEEEVNTRLFMQKDPSLYGSFLLFRQHTHNLRKHYTKDIGSLQARLNQERQAMVKMFQEKKRFDILETHHKTQDSVQMQKQLQASLDDFCMRDSLKPQEPNFP